MREQIAARQTDGQRIGGTIRKSADGKILRIDGAARKYEAEGTIETDKI